MLGVVHYLRYYTNEWLKWHVYMLHTLWLMHLSVIAAVWLVYSTTGNFRDVMRVTECNETWHEMIYRKCRIHRPQLFELVLLIQFNTAALQKYQTIWNCLTHVLLRVAWYHSHVCTAHTSSNSTVLRFLYFTWVLDCFYDFMILCTMFICQLEIQIHGCKDDNLLL